MIHARAGWPIVPPLELDGIRYQQSEHCFDPVRPESAGYLEAIDIQTEQRLWFKQIYDCDFGTAPEFATTAHDPVFLRMKFRPGTRELLIENTIRGKYFINIDTQQVRQATPADFPPPVKRALPPEVSPIEFKGMRYEQIMNGHDALRPERCGYLDGIDIKTGEGMWIRQIYSVPFNDEIEDDTQECYFTRMVLLPGQQDILIENEAGDKYLFNLKRCDTRPLTIAESDYQPVSLAGRIKDSLRSFFQHSGR